MANQSAVLIATFQAIGLDIKTLLANQGNLDGLTTTDKSNLVAALNEVRAMIGESGAAIDDDNISDITTYSSEKIEALVADAVEALVDDAPSAYDTLGKLSAAIETLITAGGNYVRFDEEQELTEGQQVQASENIGVGDPSTDFLDVYETAKE